MNRRVFSQAIQDFQRAKRRADMQNLLARWRGRSLDLLSYEDVRQQLQAFGKREVGLQEIPLSAIVGSVGRYRDFNRNFLPRVDSDKSRWAGVKAAQVEQGLPPIEVYQIGEAFFVLDGNHRVSVAREMGNETIEAYVCEVKTRVPLTPDDEPADIILKAEYTDFLSRTHLDETQPEVNFQLTSPGKFPVLLEHIEVHRYYLGVEQNREIPYDEAANHWCEHIYLPTVQLIRETGLLHDFPERTAADMYVWLADHRAEVEQMLGWKVPTEMAVVDMAENFGSFKPGSLKSATLQSALPRVIEDDHALEHWRGEALSSIDGQPFLKTLLVPFSGAERGWRALDQAIVLAQREGSHIYGLFAVPKASGEETILTQALKEAFDRRCEGAGVSATFIVEEGDIEKLVARRGRWADVMVLQKAKDPEGDSLQAPLVNRLIRQAAGPLLVVPGEISPLKSALLAYDDRPESEEALCLTAYLGGHWQIPVTALHVTPESDTATGVLEKASSYLSAVGIDTEAIARDGDVAEVIVETAAEQGNDLIIMGSPRLNTMFEMVLGSTVRTVLDQTSTPLLLCR